MSYRYYGGTRETSIERDMADVKWLREHGSDRAKQAVVRGDKAIGILTLVICGLFVVGVIALIIWGIQNLATSGFSWQLLVFNPITFIAVIVGFGWTMCKY